MAKVLGLEDNFYCLEGIGNEDNYVESGNTLLTSPVSVSLTPTTHHCSSIVRLSNFETPSLQSWFVFGIYKMVACFGFNISRKTNVRPGPQPRIFYQNPGSSSLNGRTATVANPDNYERVTVSKATLGGPQA
ncbi:OLC1v1023254C1 [Oldenlandia corymbosa var. corymbosa]|uniref:OLC1v1023254C1 n=1 Tax=Oldenlandia corymbosa var. corymbosa TaxID=529605 RepID=A0AAV1C384_OLDCO|nr:OLC1v1023254C1 [Oldenlandia corymbosa var. corymbosa]